MKNNIIYNWLSSHNITPHSQVIDEIAKYSSAEEYWNNTENGGEMFEFVSIALPDVSTNWQRCKCDIMKLGKIYVDESGEILDEKLEKYIKLAESYLDEPIANKVKKLNENPFLSIISKSNFGAVIFTQHCFLHDVCNNFLYPYSGREDIIKQTAIFNKLVADIVRKYFPFDAIREYIFKF